MPVALRARVLHAVLPSGAPPPRPITNRRRLRYTMTVRRAPREYNCLDRPWGGTSGDVRGSASTQPGGGVRLGGDREAPEPTEHGSPDRDFSAEPSAQAGGERARYVRVDGRWCTALTGNFASGRGCLMSGAPVVQCTGRQKCQPRTRGLLQLLWAVPFLEDRVVDDLAKRRPHLDLRAHRRGPCLVVRERSHLDQPARLARCRDCSRRRVFRRCAPAQSSPSEARW